MTLSVAEAQALAQQLGGRFELVKWMYTGQAEFRGNLPGYEVQLSRDSSGKWSLYVSGLDVHVLKQSSPDAAINAVVAKLADNVSLNIRAVKALTGVEL